VCALTPPPPGLNSELGPSPINPGWTQSFFAWLGSRHRLTRRELEFVQLRARLLGHKQVANRMGLRVTSVQRLQATMLRKLGVTGGLAGLLVWIETAHQDRVRLQSLAARPE
jgi:DNA-binding CsgD family transcriptional regulator